MAGKKEVAYGKAMTKSEILGELAEKVGVSKKQVGELFTALDGLVKRELGKKGPQQFVIPGLLKLKVKVTEARKAGMFMNQFTKTMEKRDAKPASKKVRATALKNLKEALN